MITVKLFKKVKIIDRLLAKMIDIIVTLIVYVSLLCFIHHYGFEQYFYTRYDYINKVIPFFLYVAAYLALNIYFLMKNQQTFGKYLRGIRIINIYGNNIALWRIIFIRELFFIAIYAFSPTQTMQGIAFLIVILDSLFVFRENRRCLHDLICESQVVYINTNAE